MKLASGIGIFFAVVIGFFVGVFTLGYLQKKKTEEMISGLKKRPAEATPWRKETISGVEFEYKEVETGYLVRLNGAEHKFTTTAEIQDFIFSHQPG